MSIALNDTLANFCCTKCTNTPKRTRARACTQHCKKSSTASQRSFDLLVWAVVFLVAAVVTAK